ncbi:hypothetical protein KL942_002773 [Ogataea angusta]|uniref:Zn(2)-C6 fungal-type domain-containing protein n=1 Tax=Pichia angusta TaxID=870730 RepID=A0ABQ7RST8_PICAN|nr:hypothetical protein KL942_002773 [Ogataea angusta]KAG7846633.1 hypothetical protein KL940_004231 [Ogataea angusta]
MGKITRSRKGCFTCKQRRRKCDETKPSCLNCVNSGRKCAGYGLRLVFDVDDSRNEKGKVSTDAKGQPKYGFRGRPRINNGDLKLAVKKSTSSEPETVQSVEPAAQPKPESQPWPFSPNVHFDDVVYSGLDYLLSTADDLSLFSSEQAHQQQQYHLQQLEQQQDQLLQQINAPQSVSESGAYPFSLDSELTSNPSEDNYILKHFFDKTIFLLDAQPSAPWPELMLRFGSLELAKSCFLSLSSIHLYVNNGSNKFYKKGILHINNTMEYLIKYVRTKDTSRPQLTEEDGAGAPLNVDSIHHSERPAVQVCAEPHRPVADADLHSVVVRHGLGAGVARLPRAVLQPRVVRHEARRGLHRAHERLSRRDLPGVCRHLPPAPPPAQPHDLRRRGGRRARRAAAAARQLPRLRAAGAGGLVCVRGAAQSGAVLGDLGADQAARDVRARPARAGRDREPDAGVHPHVRNAPHDVADRHADGVARVQHRAALQKRELATQAAAVRPDAVQDRQHGHDQDGDAADRRGVRDGVQGGGDSADEGVAGVGHRLSAVLV